MKTGFIVGKFCPPHRGHKHLIEQARRQVDRLIVVVAAHPSQSIPGELRRAWLEEIHPDCEVRLVPDELGDHHRAWADFTVQFLGAAPDVVFSSEDYGPEFARFMGAEHVMIDRDRRAVPVSATAIRAAPLDHLHFLEPPVRAHFVKRVALVGAESTGKTTLAERLAAHFQTVCVPEFAREHWERKLVGYSLDSPPPAWTREDFLEIAATQQRNENAAARLANRVMFADTNAFATGTWFERYNRARDPEVDAIGSRDTVDLYLHTAPDIPFVQDGVRDGEAIRDWMDRRFTEQLSAQATPVVRLEGPPDDRFRAAAAAVEALLEKR